MQNEGMNIMKILRIISAALCAVILTTGSAFAKSTKGKADKTYKYNYTITYETFAGDDISQAVGSDTALASAEITEKIPEREGYVFGGWSVSGYDSDEVYNVGDTVKLNDSMRLCAVWRSEGSFVLSYTDGKEKILPSQRVYGGRARITELIPKKRGYTFVGWSKDEKPTSATLAPGDDADISADTALHAVWNAGETIVPKIYALSVRDGRTVFSWAPVSGGGSMKINLYSLNDDEMQSFNADAALGSYEQVLPSGQYAVSAALSVGSGKFERFAEGEETRFFVPDYPEDEIKVLVNGRRIEFDAPPYITNGSTMVPMRAVLEALGATVTWDELTASAAAVCNTVVTKFSVGSTVFSRNGKSGFLPEAAALVGGRTYIPLRAISESFGFSVEWDGDGRAIYIFSEYAPGIAPDIYYIKDETSGKYLAYDDTKGEVFATRTADFSAAWIVQPSGDFFEIYPLNVPDKPLEVSASEVTDGAALRVWARSGYDGCLWRIEREGDGVYRAAPFNNGSLSLSVDDAAISKTNAEFNLVPVGVGGVY